MQAVTSVENMRRSDAATISRGISSRELMARAGRCVFDAVEFIPPVAVVCGTGNNAGDGYVIAELLREKGIACRIFLLEERFSEDGKFYFHRCLSAGVPVSVCAGKPDFSGFGTVVDCLFGTGFTGDVRGAARGVIEAINASGVYVVSVDINSGLDGDSGMAGLCVVSDLTVSIGSYKSGHFLGMAKDVIGRKLNCDIGIELIEPPARLIEAEDIRPLFSGRRNFSNKGDYGYVALIGGSTEYSGAVKLANLACSALRAGAGVVKLAAPASLSGAILPYLLESTFFPLSDCEGRIIFCEHEMEALLNHTRAVAAGMGMGRSAEGGRLISHLVSKYTGRLIIDADGLNMLAEQDRALLRNAPGSVILTPHIKEFERLSGRASDRTLCDPLGSARDYARQTGSIVLLKGTATVVTDGETTYLTDRGTPGMATAGSGDVLSGILAGICGFVPDGNLLLGVAAGAYLNGLAGEMAARELNPVSMLAGDTARHLAAAVSTVLGK